MTKPVFFAVAAGLWLLLPLSARMPFSPFKALLRAVKVLTVSTGTTRATADYSGEVRIRVES